MARTFDATKDEDFALFALNDAQLAQRHGIKGDELEALRKAQYEAPAATSAEEVREALKAQSRKAAKADTK